MSLLGGMDGSREYEKAVGFKRGVKHCRLWKINEFVKQHLRCLNLLYYICVKKIVSMTDLNILFFIIM